MGAYGLAADNTLEWEVVTAEGEHLLATPELNSDLYWALSGGGGGTYAVVVSLKVKAHLDGPVGGAQLQFYPIDVPQEAYWDAISVFHEGLATLISNERSPCRLHHHQRQLLSQLPHLDQSFRPRCWLSPKAVPKLSRRQPNQV